MKDLKVLIAFASSEKLLDAREALSPLKTIKFFESKDGTDVIFKLSNASPDVLVVEHQLPRRTGMSICEWVSQQKNLGEMAMILVTDEKLSPALADVAASGRIQAIAARMDPTELKLAFVKAFNYGSGTQDFQVRLVPAGEVLIREGDKATSVFLVQSGKLLASTQVAGERKVLGEIGPGEFVGEMAYINQDMRSATVTAETDAELVEIPIQNVDQILFQRPSWAKALMRTLSKRLKFSNRKSAES